VLSYDVIKQFDTIANYLQGGQRSLTLAYKVQYHTLSSAFSH
jgi:hypothetical protein